MVKKIIYAPKGLPFSKAIVHDQNYTMEIAGQVGLDPENGKLEDGIEEQTKRTMENIHEILQEVGWNFDNVIKSRIYLVNMKDYATVNDIYVKFFNKDFPTRVALAVKELPLGALIEIDCTASGDNVK